MSPDNLPEKKTHIDLTGGLYIGGAVNTDSGDFIGRDKQINGDEIHGDKITYYIVTNIIAAPALLPTSDIDIPYQSFEPAIISIPAGVFTLGAVDTPSPWQEHSVTLSAYQIGKYPVTNAQYAAFIQHESDHRPYKVGWRFIKPPIDKLEQPVTGIRWGDALAYCRWLSQQSGRYYRLPSEAEWENALYSGMMISAIQEWTSTIWGDDTTTPTFIYPYKPDGRDDLTISNVCRIWRSGIETSTAQGVLSVTRGFASPQSRLDDLGFRVALDV